MSRDDRKTTKIETPAQGNDSLTAKMAAPIATISSHSDPWPAYLMAAATSGAAVYSWSTLNNPRAAAIKGGLAAAYLWSGKLLTEGNPTLGYDVGSIASIALAAVYGPKAWATGEALSVAMGSLGGISAVANVIKSYEMRTGKPKELGVRRD